MTFRRRRRRHRHRRSGNDHFYGDAGTDHCVGGAGKDLCDGGEPHYATPGADPDICSTDAEKHVSCKEKEAGGYSGFASGTVTYDDGLLETWSAKVDMPTFGTDYYVGTTTISWTVSGTNKTTAPSPARPPTQGRLS